MPMRFYTGKNVDNITCTYTPLVLDQLKRRIKQKQS